MVNIPVIDLRGTGRNIMQLRQQKGLSVKELQAILGFASPQAIYKWQHGDALPTVDNLLALSVLFDVSINTILVTMRRSE